MKQVIIKRKILNIQNELEFLKRFFIEKTDFNIDEKNWKEIRPTLKEIRKRIYQKSYVKK